MNVIFDSPLKDRYLQTLSCQDISLEDFEQALESMPERVLMTLGQLTSTPPDFILGLYVGTSGGKDSVVVHHLAKLSVLGRSIQQVLHTAKPGITHPETLKFLYSRNYPILFVPKGCPMPRGLKTQIDGTRALEYSRTDGRSTDLVVGGKTMSRQDMPMFVDDGLFGMNFIFPIYDWTDAQVWAYIMINGIEYSDEYLIPKGENVIAPGAK